MTAHSILNTVFHAAMWRAVHGLAPAAALVLAVIVAALGLYLSRR